jgi:hypothetical protein
MDKPSAASRDAFKAAAPAILNTTVAQSKRNRNPVGTPEKGT